MKGAASFHKRDGAAPLSGEALFAFGERGIG